MSVPSGFGEADRTLAAGDMVFDEPSSLGDGVLALFEGAEGETETVAAAIVGLLDGPGLDPGLLNPVAELLAALRLSTAARKLIGPASRSFSSLRMIGLDAAPTNLLGVTAAVGVTDDCGRLAAGLGVAAFSPVREEAAAALTLAASSSKRSSEGTSSSPAISFSAHLSSELNAPLLLALTQRFVRYLISCCRVSSTVSRACPGARPSSPRSNTLPTSVWYIMGAVSSLRPLIRSESNFSRTSKCKPFPSTSCTQASVSAI